MEQEEVKRLIQNFKNYSDKEFFTTVIETLKSFGDVSVDELINALEDEDVNVRTRAVQALGAIGDKKALKPLLGKLADVEEDEDVRWNVSSVLPEFKDSQSVEPLLKILKDKSAILRNNAAWSLSRIGDKIAVEPIIELLQDEDEKVRHEAALALADLGDYRATQPIIKLLNNQAESVREIYAEALGTLGDEQAILPLILALEDLDEQVEDDAHGALVMIGSAAVLPLIEALKSKKRDLRWSAVSLLKTIKDKRAIPHLEEALHDEDENVRDAARSALDYINEYS